MMKNTVKLSLVLLILIGSCSPKINFIGNQYEPTTHVALIFDVKDIEREYQVMGFLQNEGREFANEPEQIKAALIEEAKKRGADAILFDTGYNEQVSGSDTFGFGDRHKNGDIFGANTSWNSYVKIFKVKLIKYK